MAPEDLYSSTSRTRAFRTPWGGNLGGSLETCVSYAEIPEHPGAYARRDTKRGSASPELRFSAAEMTDFVTALSTTQGDHA